MKVPDTFLDQVDIFVLLTAFGGKGDIILIPLKFCLLVYSVLLFSCT